MLSYFKSRTHINKLAAGLAVCVVCCSASLEFAQASPQQQYNAAIRRMGRQDRKFLRQQNRRNNPFVQAPVIAPVSSPEGLALLQRMLEAENSISYSGTQVTTVSRQELALSSQQRVTSEGTNGIRIEYFQPAQLAGELIVDDGSHYWHYIPSTNTMDTSQSRMKQYRKRIHQEISEVQRGTLSVSVVGQDSIAGRPCAIIEVHTNMGKRGFRRFWVNSATGAQLKVEEYRPNGKLQSTSFFTQIAFNPAIGPDTFTQPRTPAGVTKKHENSSKSVGSIAEAQTQAGFTVQQPSYLPAGFGFQSAQVSNFRDNKMAVLHYNNGLNVISLYETPVEPGRGNANARSPRAGVVTKTQAGLRLLVVGSLSIDEMTQMINSVR